MLAESREPEDGSDSVENGGENRERPGWFECPYFCEVFAACVEDEGGEDEE
jgi:hypothetical protein